MENISHKLHNRLWRQLSSQIYSQLGSQLYNPFAIHLGYQLEIQLPKQ